MAEITVTLLPLLCVRCQSPIAANPGEAAWACSQCRQGLVLDELRGLQPMEINYHAVIPPNQPGQPYWVVSGLVTLNRQIYGGGNQAGEANNFWAVERQFFIPAYHCSAQQLAAAGARLLTQPPTLHTGSPTPFAPVILPPSDVQSVTQYLVMTIEAGRKDRLKSLSVNVKLGVPVLWILPA
jgi:hypothetical protein